MRASMCWLKNIAESQHLIVQLEEQSRAEHPSGNDQELPNN